MSPPPTQPTADRSLRDLLIDKAFEQGKGGVPMTAVAVIAIAIIHWIEQGKLLAPWWTLSMLGLTLARILLLFVHARYGRQLATRTRERIYICPLLITSVGWVILPFLNFPTATAIEKLGMVCVMSGLAGGATSILSPIGWPARFYLACILLPGAILIRDMPGGGPVITGLGFCFLAIMLIAHSKAHTILVDGFRRMQDNHRLIAEAQQHRAEMERLNEALVASQQVLQEHNAELALEVANRSKKMQLAYSVIENTTEGVLILSADALAVEVNPAFTRITGYAPEEIIGRSVRVLRSNRHDEAFFDALWNRLTTVGKWEGELWSRRKDGSLFLERRTLDALRDHDGNITHYVSVFNDITDSHIKDEQLRHLAFHDPLTGLGNRALLRDRLEQAITLARRHRSRVAVLYLDLDQFKSVNDSLGHHVGDRLLQAVAERLHDCLRASDTLARIGGDEFVVLLNDIQEVQDCGQLASKLLAAIAAPLDLDAARMHVRSSLGIAVFPEDGEDAETLMRSADMAMYSAKAAGRNTFRYFHKALSAQAEQRLQMELALRDAIDREQFRLHFQAKVAPGDGRTIGYEALLRWQHPEWGNVPPDRFIPVAEDAGLIGAIGAWVIASACRQLAAWQRQGFGWQHVAINVSARQFEEEDLATLIQRETDAHQVPCHCLEVEVTESVVVARPESTLPVLRRLREMGLTIAIDDFGTGQSSLAYLRRLPVDVLKIDRAFVQDMDVDEHALAIVRMILALSQTLHLKTVAEGVETPNQAQLLQSGGCTLLQGYLFARPLSAEALEASWRSTRSI